MRIQVNFILKVLSFQIFISLIINEFFLYDFTPGNIFNYSFFISSLFLFVVSVLAYDLNRKLKIPYRATILGLFSVIPFLILVLIAHYVDIYNVKRFLGLFISSTFLHLGGFRDLCVYILGIKSIYYTFYAINTTIILHMLGFLFGDAAYIFINKKRKKANNVDELHSIKFL